MFTNTCETPFFTVMVGVARFFNLESTIGNVLCRSYP